MSESSNILEASESDPTPCNTCGHVEDAHEDGGDCQEERCECTAFSVLVEAEDGEAEPIPRDAGPEAVNALNALNNLEGVTTCHCPLCEDDHDPCTRPIAHICPGCGRALCESCAVYRKAGIKPLCTSCRAAGVEP